MNGENISDEMKKIIVVSKTIYPSNNPRSFRTTELVKEFRRQGHKVTLYIVKEFEIQDEIANNFGFELKNLGKPFFKPIIIKSNNVLIRAFKRILLLLFEYPDIELMWLVNKAIRKERNYDLLISIAVPHPIHWGVAWARTTKNPIAKTWVADCGDPYMGCTTDSFKKRFHFKYIEKWFSRKADFISVPNKDHIGFYYPEFYSKITIIPQGFKFEDSKIFHGTIENSVPTFAFAGVLLKIVRDPVVLLEYLSDLKDDFHFILYTENHKILEPYKYRLGSKLELRNYIPREDLLFELSKMDFLVNIENHSSVKSNSPSKLIDYAITKKPILSLSMENFDKQKVDEFLKGNYNKKLILKNINGFRIENVAEKFIQLIGSKNE